MGKRRKATKNIKSGYVLGPNLPRICLNMIVKNEEHVLKELFETIKKYIDYWVICDTGSTDGTVKLIEEYFDAAGIPGEIHHHEWKDFGHNRSLALEACRGKAQYVWVIDADDLVVGNFQLPKNMTADGYNLKYGSGGIEYIRNQIFNNALEWKYIGVLHEYAHCETKEDTHMETIEGDYHIDSRRLGDRNKAKDKYLRDAKILEKGLEEDPTNSRYAFYLAQSWRDHGDHEKALECYRKCVEMNGWFEEVYCSKYEIAVLMHNMGKPWDEVENAYLEAYRELPRRAEPLYQLAYYYRAKDDFQKGYEYAVKGAALPYPSDLKLFLQRDVYEWKLLDEVCISGFWAGKYKEAADAGLKALNNPTTPIDHHQRMRQNVKYSTDKLKELRAGSADRGAGDAGERKVIGFYGGYAGVDSSRAYGSELALQNVAERLANDHNYDVHVFSYPTHKLMVRNGVKYHPAGDLHHFGEIDVMIVSRYIHYFIDFKDRAKYTYIWMHDTLFHAAWDGKMLPEHAKYLMQNLGEKIDGFIALSEWHRKLVHDFYEIPMDKIHIIGNGLNSSYFKSDEARAIKKIPRKFIWSSSPVRGLDKLIEYFHEIHAEFPDATLHIYRGRDDFDKNTVKWIEAIESCDYITFGDKLPQKELAKEFLSADVWFYPTSFTETYCMSALEAQMSGCACIATDLAALHTTVGDRGHLITSQPYTAKYKEDAIGAVREVLRDDAKKRAMQDAGRQWAAKQDWDNVVRIWKNLIEVGIPEAGLEVDAESVETKSELKIKTRVVNLDRRPDRWEAFEKCAAKAGLSDVFEYERFSAVDGKSLTLTPRIQKLFRNNNFNYRQGVVGCAMSHVKLWEELVKEPEGECDYYLVLEDDTTFCDDFPKKVAVLIEQIKEKPCELVYVGHSVWRQYFKKEVYHNQNMPKLEVCNDRHKVIGGTFGYIISRSGAQKYLNCVEKYGIQFGIDVFMIGYVDILGIGVYRSMPHLVYSDIAPLGDVRADSDIQKDIEPITKSNTVFKWSLRKK